MLHEETGVVPSPPLFGTDHRGHLQRTAGGVLPQDRRMEREHGQGGPSHLSFSKQPA